MIRKLCVLAALCLAAISFTFAPQAAAQGETQCRILFVEDPAEDPPPPVSTVTPTTDADTETTTDSAVAVASADATALHSCAEAQAYPGPFTNMPVTPSSPYSAPTSLTAPSPAAPVAVSTPSGVDLAHSGSETFVLAYLGTGLLAFGAVALGIRRGSVTDE